MGDAVVAQPALPQFDPFRLQGNGIVDVDVRPPMSGGGGDQRGDRPVGPFAVTLSPITLPNGSTIALGTGNVAQVFDYAALVKWGRGGTVHTALVDWPVNGGTFVVTGDSLYVDAWALLPTTGIFSANFRSEGLDVRMGAHATPLFSPAGDNLPPRRTMLLPTPIAAPAGTSGETFVPPFARRVKFQWNNLITQGGGAWVITLLYRRFGATFAQDVIAFTGSQPSLVDVTRELSIPTTTQTIVVNNTAGVTAIDNGALVYDLDLGG